MSSTDTGVNISQQKSVTDVIDNSLIFNKSGLFDEKVYKDNRKRSPPARHIFDSSEKIRKPYGLFKGYFPDFKYWCKEQNVLLIPSKYDDKKYDLAMKLIGGSDFDMEECYKEIPYIKNANNFKDKINFSSKDDRDKVNFSLPTEANGLVVITLKKSMKNGNEFDSLYTIFNWYTAHMVNTRGSDDIKEANPFNTLVQMTPSGNYQLIYRTEYAIGMFNSFGDILSPIQDGDKNKLGITLKYRRSMIKLFPAIGKSGEMYQLVDNVFYEGKELKTDRKPNLMPRWLIRKIIIYLQNNNYDFINVDRNMISKNTSDISFKFDSVECLNKRDTEIFNRIMNSSMIDYKLVCKLLDKGLFEDEKNCIRFTNMYYNVISSRWDNDIIVKAMMSNNKNIDEIYSRHINPLFCSGTKHTSFYKKNVTLGTLLYFLKKSIPIKKYRQLAYHIVSLIKPDINTDFYEYKKFHDYDYADIDQRLEMQNFIRSCIKKVDGSGSIIYYINAIDTTKIGERRREVLFNSEHELISKLKNTRIRSLHKKEIFKKGSSEPVIEYKSGNLWELVERYIANNEFCCYRGIAFIPVSPFTKDDKYIKTSLCDLKKLNTFTEFAVRYESDFKVDMNLIKPAFDQINAFCNGKQECVDYFIKLLAHMVQKPATKTGIATVIRSPQGSGKTEFFKWFGNMILGEGLFTSVSSMETVTGRFNSTTSSKLMIILEEVNVYENNCMILNKLKDLITSDTQLVEYKGKETITLEDFCNYFLLTNKIYVIRTEAGDRRYFILQAVPLYPIADPRWDEQIKFYKDPVAASHFYHYLMSVNVTTSMLKNIPQTDAKDDLTNRGAPLILRHLHEVYVNYVIDGSDITNSGFGLDDKILSLPSLKLSESLKDYCITNDEGKPPSASTIKSYMQNTFGSSPIRKNIPGSGGNGKYPSTYYVQLDKLREVLLKYRFDISEEPNVEDLE